MATGVPRTRNVTRPTVDSDLRPASQTLDRGLRVLEHITESLTPLTVAEVARDVGMHRSITYRMLRTLEDHGLIAPDELGRGVFVDPGGVGAEQLLPRSAQICARQFCRKKPQLLSGFKDSLMDTELVHSLYGRCLFLQQKVKPFLPNRYGC